MINYLLDFYLFEQFDPNRLPFLFYFFQKMFYRCHFEYSPNEDKQFPKGEAGLSFQAGDILEVIDQSDSDWWQVFTTFIV